METQIPTYTLRGKDKVLITTLLPKVVKCWNVPFIVQLSQSAEEHPLEWEGQPHTEDMEDTNTDEIEIAYAESIFSPAKGWLQ